ncbi:MAG: glycosyltransferase [Cyanobacteria bacterium P01_E01_bin.43]
MGRLDWGKGADIALDMFECLAQDAPDCEFYAYAYPWKNDPTSQALHYRLQSHPTVTYIEAKLVDDLDTMDANLRASIDAVDVFFLPYRALLSTIDSPLVPMEVAARCKPFVTTDIEGLPSLPVKGGVFLPPDHAQDPARVAEALYGLIQAPDSSPDLSYSVSAVADVMCQAIADAAPKTGPARSAKRI